MFAATLPFPEISPEIFSREIGGFTFALRWYALAYIAGLVIAWRMVVAMARRPQLWPGNVSPMERDHPDDLLTWIIVGVVLGGRLGFVLFYQPGYYLANPGDILKVWQGGMSFHGGFLGVIVAVALFCQRNGLSMVRVGDAIAVATPPGLFLGRVANFINAELWGRPSDLPWAVEFPGLAAQYCPAVEGVCARHPSQLYEAALEGLLLGAVLVWLAWRKGGLKRPGAMIGVFLAGYGGARFIVEFFRQPDAQFVSEGNPLGLIAGTGMTMGQLLSLPMIVVGVIVVLAARRRA
ncbi:MAG: prolipoprotein diacylglyceryl transferase [Paracoccaceae bacterium]